MIKLMATFRADVRFPHAPILPYHSDGMPVPIMTKFCQVYYYRSVGRFLVGCRGIPPFRNVRERMGHPSRRRSTASRECLSGFIALDACKGSFDCVLVRGADENSAQDDSGLGPWNPTPSQSARRDGALPQLDSIERMPLRVYRAASQYGVLRLRWRSRCERQLRSG